MQPVEMKNGAAISGALHLGFLALALFGADFFSGRDSAPLVVTEVELIDGANFEAALSTAPVVPNEGPSELSPQAENDVEPVNLAAPDVAFNVPDMPILPMTEAPADETPDLAALMIPPPPTIVPTEAPRPSIAIIPSPDELQRQAAEPESPPATEPMMALAAAPAPEPAPRPIAPQESDPLTSEPTPAEAPRASAPPIPEPDELPRQAADPESPAATEPLQPLATVSPPESKPIEPQHEQEPEPEPEVVTAPVPQPDAPVSDAPQEARLPVAKPAKLAAAARASSATETVAAAPEPPDEPRPAEAAGGSTAKFASAVTRGEKDALRLGIKKYFVYSGSGSDRALQVTIEIHLSRDAKVIGKAKRLRASGGNKAMQTALFNAGRRALLKAQNAGEFKKLPLAKYDGWKLIYVTFTPEEIGFSS
jgi:hypothetical protein